MALLADGRADAIAAQGAAVDSCTAQDATAGACASAARNAHAEAGGGDYAPRHLDPRAALAILVAINVSMALSQSIVAEAGVLALAIASMLYCRRYAAIARWLAAYALFAVLVHLFLMSGSTLLSPFAASLLMFRHVLPAFMFASNTIATTRLGELACALQAVHVPANVSVAICVAFRFLPTMGREFSAVNDAMKTRGIAISPKSLLLHPAQTAEHFLVPVMARLGTVADELGNAVTVRGVGSGAHRTSYYLLRMHAVDMASMLAACILVVVAACVKAGVL